MPQTLFFTNHECKCLELEITRDFPREKTRHTVGSLSDPVVFLGCDPERKCYRQVTRHLD